MTTPLFFVSHGAPDIALSKGATVSCWERLAQDFPRPQAILILSAHWTTKVPTLSTVQMPATLHDFGGFDPALYQMQYPAPGAAQLAGRISQVLGDAGIELRLDSQRGLDHGAWVPLRSMYPEADIPVAQLSIQSQAGTEWHVKLGKALRPLREEGILIMASGAVTHNFGWLSPLQEVLPAAQTFSDWLGDALEKRRMNDLLAYRTQAPYGSEAHPTEEHILPLYAAFGASNDDETLTRFTPETTYSALVMDAYRWA